MIINVGYIDPSVMTYAVQAIAGVVIAVGAVVVVAWRRAKKKVAEKLHLDDVSRKEQEDEICIIDEETEESIVAEASKGEVIATEE